MGADENVHGIPPVLPVGGDERGWGLSWAIFAYLGFFAIQLVPAVVIVIIYTIYCYAGGRVVPKEPGDFPAAVLMVAAMVSQVVTIVWVYFLVRMVHALPFRRGISWDSRRPLADWKAVAAGFALMLFNAAFYVFVAPPAEGLNVPIMELTRTSEGLFMFGFMAIFIAPVSEELLFRGYIFAPIERRYGAAAAISVTTALFMTPHLLQLGEYWQGVILIGLLGVTTGVLRAHTGGVRAGVICHLIYNTLLVLSEALGRIAPPS